MKQLSAKLKSRGATAVVLTLALGAAVYLNWSFSREAPPSLVVSDTAGKPWRPRPRPLSRSPIRSCWRQLPGPIRR